MKIRTCAIQRRAKHDDKARDKITTGREQRHLNEYTLGCLREQTKWPAGVPIRLQLEFCIEEAVLWKTPRCKSSDCSTEAICRSFWPTRYCLEKSNRTNTHNYCNATAHVCQGLTISAIYYLTLFIIWIFCIWDQALHLGDIWWMPRSISAELHFDFSSPTTSERWFNLHKWVWVWFW